jgi:hypothetical protein
VKSGAQSEKNCERRGDELYHSMTTVGLRVRVSNYAVTLESIGAESGEPESVSACPVVSPLVRMRQERSWKIWEGVFE